MQEQVPLRQVLIVEVIVSPFALFTIHFIFNHQDDNAGSTNNNYVMVKKQKQISYK